MCRTCYNYLPSLERVPACFFGATGVLMTELSALRVRRSSAAMSGSIVYISALEARYPDAQWADMDAEQRASDKDCGARVLCALVVARDCGLDAYMAL